MALLFACTLIAVAVYLVGEVVTQPSRERQSLLRRAATYGRRRAKPEEELLRFRERVLAPPPGPCPAPPPRRRSSPARRGSRWQESSSASGSAPCSPVPPGHSSSPSRGGRPGSRLRGWLAS